VTNIVGAVHKMCSLAEEGVNTGGNDNSFYLTLFAGGTREDLTTRVLGDGQGLTGEGRLVNLKGISLQKTGICWDNIPQLDADQISWHQYCSFLFTPFSIPQHLCTKCFLPLGSECEIYMRVVIVTRLNEIGHTKRERERFSMIVPKSLIL